MKKKLPTIIIIGLIVLVVGFIIYAMLKPDDTTSNGLPKVSADPAKLAEGNYKGLANSNVVVSEFGDFQCPVCKRDNSTLNNDILPSYLDKIKFVFLNFPLPKTIHPNAKVAAQAAEAAALQGKYWEMHDLLYDKQDDWAKSDNPQSKFESYAKDLGLNVDQFKKDSGSQKIIDLINNQTALGNAFNVEGTPTYFVNGQKVEQGIQGLKQAIDKALAQ